MGNDLLSIQQFKRLFNFLFIFWAKVILKTPNRVLGIALSAPWIPILIKTSSFLLSLPLIVVHPPIWEILVHTLVDTYPHPEDFYKRHPPCFPAQ